MTVGAAGLGQEVSNVSGEAGDWESDQPNVWMEDFGELLHLEKHISYTCTSNNISMHRKRLKFSGAVILEQRSGKSADGICLSIVETKEHL